jgi:hypothetical protein
LLATPRALPPKITLEFFCQTYELSEDIQAKLAVLKVMGPHALHLIKDNQLSGEGKLVIGELADVRDAEERWSQSGAT